MRKSGSTILIRAVLKGQFEMTRLGPCLVHLKNLKLFKILRYIESCGTYMEH